MLLEGVQVIFHQPLAQICLLEALQRWLRTCGTWISGDHFRLVLWVPPQPGQEYEEAESKDQDPLGLIHSDQLAATCLVEDESAAIIPNKAHHHWS